LQVKALDAVMSLLPRRRSARGRHEVSRYSLTDYFTWVYQSVSSGGLGAYGVTTTYGKSAAEPIATNFEGYASGLLFADGPVASAEAYRLRVFGQAPLLFQRRVDGRPGDLYDDASLDLLRKPWLGGTCGDLMKRALLHGDLGGNAYLVLVGDELVLLRPDWVEIVLAKRMHEGYQVGWRQVGIAYYEGGLGVGDPAIFLPGEYIHFVPGLPDPLATYRGMSWLTPVIREVQADKSASDHKVKFFENAATPNLAVSLPKELTPAQFDQFVDRMDARTRGVEHAYETLYTGGGADVTVIGANMQQIDFGNVQGKGETRIANAAGVPPTLLSFSEGMQGSSLNAGNYGPTKRNFVDTTIRDLWQNWCGSAETLFPPPGDGDRLWYDPRDIPFLREDETAAAQIKSIEAETINKLVTAGFEKDSIVASVIAGDWTLLKDTGLVSVQLLPPGTTANDAADGGSGPKGSAVTAARARAWDPAKHPRDPVTGRFINAKAFAELIKKLDNDRKGSFADRLKDAARGDAALDAAPYKQWLEPDGPHKDAVFSYTGGGYLGINADLRVGRFDDRRTKNDIRRLDEAMADSPLGSDVVVVRGIRDPRAVFGDAWNDSDVSGLEWSELSFASSSTNVAQTGRTYFTGNSGVRMEILVPKGTSALAASRAGEAELLLNRGLKYRVVRDDGVVDGIRRISVEVLHV
jgi:phage portal protein BeeE